MKLVQAIVSTIILVITSFNVSADYTVDKGPIRVRSPQDIVLTLSEDPTMKPEVACLALTMGQFIRDSSPKVNVTLFLKNDGVGLADAATVSSVTDLCQTPYGARTLEENLRAFIMENDNNLVNCPICWGARFGMQTPDYGIREADAIPQLLLGADKVIDF
ncbi:MAG: hypothetical protein EP297_15960 [Gammaproteobacteria bacterium]|nr:MAG: hypothetical protein EP297_15960 [Gammaproteobacteria bacterium]